VQCCAVLPARALVATGGRCGVVRAYARKLKSWRGWECAATLVGHSGWVRAVEFTSDGQFLVSASGDWTIRVWDIADLSKTSCMVKLEGHQGWVQAINCLPPLSTGALKCV
jgi:WD40 repeat protein